MRTHNLIGVALVTIASLFIVACGGGPDRNTSNRNSRDANHNATTGNGGSDDAGDDEEALILSTENDVSLKLKGAASFVTIFKNVPFHNGDTLRIGAQSKAVVFCKDACDLGPGDYVKCCTPECKIAIDNQPPPTEQHKFFMMKKDLSPSEARVFEEQESKIDGLGLGKTATQLLKANLYTSWRLNEASEQIQALDQQLEKPEAQEELSEGYREVILKTADLYVKVNQQDKAVRLYKKAIEVTPSAANTSPHSDSEKATAHARLAEIYSNTGQKAEAVDNLTHAKEIYTREGDQKKVQAVDTRILKLKSQR